MFLSAKQESNEKITSTFLNSLSYFETVNLLTMIYKANNPKWSEAKCYSEATASFSDHEMTQFKFDELLKTGLHCQS